MASTNQSPFYQKAEEEYLKATSDKERLECLEIMMKEVPKHKSSEKMRKNLTNRYKKLKTSMAKQKKSGKSTQIGIKKADMQCVLAGFPNTGKSTIFKILTSQPTKISPHEFTTFQPQLGTFNFEDAQIQIIDQPSFPSHDKSLTNSTDTLLLVIDNLDQIKKTEDYTYRTHAKIILIFNKSDTLSETELRKIKATLNSKFKKYSYVFLNQNSTKLELKKLKQKIFKTFPIIRVYTKEPKKEPSKDPMILKKNSTFKMAADKILKGMSKKIKRARVWGPSSKFGGQVIGLEHILKDKDVIEFQTK
ncbi:TGS domain-containing protein [Methanococcoides sp. SA1]|nr:TGS domain-containing protein [Methanococcoides sp. SA1]